MLLLVGLFVSSPLWIANLYAQSAPVVAYGFSEGTGVTTADMQRVARAYLRPELAYVAAIGPRASLAAIAPPVADETPVGMAS